jgi:hypothetical protein
VTPIDDILETILRNSLTQLLSLSSSTLPTCHLLLWTTRALISRHPSPLPPAILPSLSAIISTVPLPTHLISRWSTQSHINWSEIYLLSILSLLSMTQATDQTPLLSQSVSVLLASMIDILSSPLPSLQYLSPLSKHTALCSPLSVFRAPIPDSSLWNSQTFLTDFFSPLLSPQSEAEPELHAGKNLSIHQLLKQLPSTSQATLLLTVLGLPTDQPPHSHCQSQSSPLSQSAAAEERFRYALQGLEFQLMPEPTTPLVLQSLLSDEFLLLKLRSHSLTSLATILSQCSDSPNRFSSLLSPHLSSLIPALLKVPSLFPSPPHILPL